MLKVGLTGGIASGKSLAAREFATLGVPVLDADGLSHALTEPGGVGLAALTTSLGPDILDADGRLDRPRLRQRLFQDLELRQRVEKLLHPLVFKELSTGLAALQAPYALAVVPLLVEKPAFRALVDRILVVDSPAELQSARLMSRDGDTAEAAEAILAAQASRGERLAAADDILLNNDGVAALRDGVRRLHRFYLQLAAQGDFYRTGLRLP